MGKSARAADGLRSQCKIAPTGEPHPLGPEKTVLGEIQKYESRFWMGLVGWGVGGLDSVHSPDEDAIWRSEMSLKGVTGDRDTQCSVTRYVYSNPMSNNLRNLRKLEIALH